MRLKSSFLLFAAIFGFFLPVLDSKTEGKVKLYAFLISLVLLSLFVYMQKHRRGKFGHSLFNSVKSCYDTKYKALSLLILAFIFAICSTTLFSGFSVEFDRTYVSYEEYVDPGSDGCQSDNSYPKEHPVVNLSADCALKYAEHRSNWCCEYELPNAEMAISTIASDKIRDCKTIAEFVLDENSEGGRLVSLLKGGSVDPVDPFTTDKCISFRLVSKCSWACQFTDWQNKRSL